VTPQRKIQAAITTAAVAMAVAHLFWPAFEIDAIALSLLGVAAIPWLLPLLRSIELPGGLKFEFKELQETQHRAAKAGLLEEQPDLSQEHEFSFQNLADEDPNLALVGLRIEIERRLVRLARSAGISKTRAGVGQLLRLLGERSILTHEQRSVLADMVVLLNSAAHGKVADQQSAQWALDVGPKLLTTLDRRIERQ